MPEIRVAGYYNDWLEGIIRNPKKIKWFKKFNFDFSKLINVDDPFIIKIQEIINKVLDEKIDYDITQQISLKRLSPNPKYPLLYLFIKKYIQIFHFYLMK